MNDSRVVFLALFIFLHSYGSTQLLTQTSPLNKSDAQVYQPEVLKPIEQRKRKRQVKWGPRMARFFGELFQDIFYIHRNLFTWDSFKIIVTAFPFFVGLRMADEKLQRCFYDEKNHSNKNKPPRWCEGLAKFSISVPIVFLGSDALFAKDEEYRKTGRIFLTGMPFVIWTKDLIKRLKFDACLRPWHEDFSCEERSCGGFPSGHVAEATYMAVLYGMRFGPRYAVPLSVAAVFVGTIFLACNRHYASQLIAGAGFGAMYAVAANKLIDKRLDDTVKLGLKMSKGGPAMTLSFRF